MYYYTISSFTELGLGFTQSRYPVQENVRSFALCTQIESGVIAPELMQITLMVILIGGIAEGIVHLCVCV